MVDSKTLLKPHLVVSFPSFKLGSLKFKIKLSR